MTTFASGGCQPVGAESLVVAVDLAARGLDSQVVSVAGELDMATGPHLWEHLAAAIPATHTRLVIDLSGTTFVDSTGMAVFVRASKQLREQGAELVLRAPNPGTRRVLAITHVDRMVTIED